MSDYIKCEKQTVKEKHSREGKKVELLSHKKKEMQNCIQCFGGKKSPGIQII
jgi:hypothetical protein